jgi:polysaccharide deacetylase 2 family uncharacterized protein YibQ
MTKVKRSLGPKTPMQKLMAKLKDIDPYFIDSVLASKDDELTLKLAEIAKNQTQIENAQSEDEDVKKLKEQLKVANESYTIPLNALKLKRKFIYKILEERGKVP